MRHGYQSLGWWMRRPTGFGDYALNDYYTQIVGLPLLRQGGLASLFWAGEDLVFEIKTGDDPGEHGTDLDSAHLLPIFRSHDLEATTRRFARAGYEVENEETTAFADTVWIRGEDHMLLGFEQRSDDSPFAADTEALRRWRSGEVTVFAGYPPLAAELQYLSRVRRRVADVQAVATFYGDVLGLDSAGSEGETSVLSLGDTVLLEIAPGGRPRQIPGDRSELPDSFITRVHGFEQFVDGLTNAGVTWVGEQILYETGSKLAYFAEPEGLVVGIESRTLWGNYPDDIEAERRWTKLLEAGSVSR